MNKSDARELFRKRRLQATTSEIAKWQDQILIHFQEIPSGPLQVVHTYLPSPEKKETDPLPLVKFLEFRNPGLKVLVPRTDPVTLRMDHILLEEDTSLYINPYGIFEPREGESWPVDSIDLVMVPMIAFDESGHRVGYGKGYYDRFLATCREKTLKIGLSFFEPVDLISDAGIFDIRLNYCVTPYRLYAF